MTKSNFKKSSYDIISATSTFYGTKLTSQDFLIMSPSQSKYLATPVRKDYAHKRNFPLEQQTTRLFKINES